MRFRKNICILCASILILLSAPINIFAKNNIVININGENIDSTRNSIYLDNNGRVMIPIRFVTEKLNKKVEWNIDSSTVKIIDDTNIIEFVIGKNSFFKNGVSKNMDTSAVIKNDTAYIPVRVFSESMNIEIEWNSDTKTVFMCEKNRLLYKNDDYSFALITPVGFSENDYIVEKSLNTENSVINVYVAEMRKADKGGLLFNIAIYDENEWNTDIKQNISVMYKELGRKNDKIIVYIPVSDVQYDLKNKDYYFEFSNSINEIIENFKIF